MTIMGMPAGMRFCRSLRSCCEPRRAIRAKSWREPAHVHTDLGNNHFRRPKIDPRDGVEEVNRLGKRDHHLRYIGAQPIDGLIDVLEVCEYLANEQTVGR